MPCASLQEGASVTLVWDCSLGTEWGREEGERNGAWWEQAACTQGLCR